MKSHLPTALSAHIDWDSLTVLPSSFVKTSLQQVHSDLLFSVRIGEKEILLYLLFEHQSTPDPTMPLRVLGYQTEIFTQHHKMHGLPLPPIVSFVFHQGPDAWNVMSVAEKLKAEGRVEGQQKGLWIGKIQTLEEFLGCGISPSEALTTLEIKELEARQQNLHREYEARFKG